MESDVALVFMIASTICWALVFGLVGYNLGAAKGQQVSGVVWGALLGPIGLLVVWSLPDIRPKDEDNLDR